MRENAFEDQRLSKIHLLDFIHGHRNAGELIGIERRERISHLTPEDSRREYERLCRFWKESGDTADIEELEKKRISFLIERRRLLNMLGGLQDRNE